MSHPIEYQPTMRKVTIRQETIGTNPIVTRISDVEIDSGDGPIFVSCSAAYGLGNKDDNPSVLNIGHIKLYVVDYLPTYDGYICELNRVKALYRIAGHRVYWAFEKFKFRVRQTMIIWNLKQKGGK